MTRAVIPAQAGIHAGIKSLDPRLRGDDGWVWLLLSFGLILPLMSVAVFEHDRAVYAAQAGDYGTAHTFVQRALTNAPDDPVILYDAGVAAYKTGDLDQASAYFSAVTQASHVDKALGEQAHFNRGNVHAKRSEYEKAIEQYQRVLETDPENKRAKHNKALMEKMLEQQKQQKQKQDKQDKQDKQNQQDQKNKQDKQNQQEQSQQANQEQNKQEQSEQQKSQSSAEQQSEQNRDDAADKQDAEQKEQKSGNEKKEHDAHQEKEQQNKNSEESIPEKRVKIDAMLERILDEQEKRDAHLNKQVIQATVKEQMAGRHDQNCW